MPLDLLYLRVVATLHAGPALVTLPSPCRSHPFPACPAAGRADTDGVGREYDSDLLKVQAPALVTPGRHHDVAREEHSHNVPEPFCRFVGHTADLSTVVLKDDRDMATPSGFRAPGNPPAYQV
jgi:hypothetical protein